MRYRKTMQTISHQIDFKIFIWQRAFLLNVSVQVTGDDKKLYILFFIPLYLNARHNYWLAVPKVYKPRPYRSIAFHGNNFCIRDKGERIHDVTAIDIV